MAGKEYQMAFSIGAKLQGQFSAAFKGAQSGVAALQTQIESLNKKQGDIAAYQKQQQAVEKTKAKLQTLQQQYANLKASMGENEEASVQMKNQMLSKELQIERTTQKLASQESQLKSTGNALTEAGVDTQKLAQASSQLDAEINGLKGQQEELAAATQETAQSMSSASDAVSGLEQMLAAAGVVAGLKAIYDVMEQCAQASIEFESVMTGVDKTTDLSAAELAEMSSAVKQLSTEIPVTTTQLGEVMEVAGQLGIAKDNLLDFSTVMSMLGTATTMTAADAATMLAQFANITGMNPSAYSNLASAIVDLGNNYATTEQKITEMGQGIAASASLAGMSEADMMGLSAAVTSLGIETQAGSTSMSKLITQINTAVETGDGLNDLASIAGMSAAQFKIAWGQDAAGALATFITGLSDTERNGKSATVVLQELGITEARMQRMMLSLSTSGDLMNRTLATANSAWTANTALTAEAEKRYGTTASKLTMAQNAANNFKIAVGDALTPAIGALAGVATDLLRPITAFIEQNPAIVQALTVAAGVIGVVTLAITAYTAAAKVATIVSALFTAAIPGMKLIMGITLAVAGLAAGITLLVNAFSSGHQSMEELDAEFDSLNEQIQEQQEIVDLCERYKSLQKELGRTQNSIENVQGLSDVGIELTAEVAAQLSPSDFVDGTEFDLTAKQANELSKMDYIPDGTLIELTAETANALAAVSFLDGTDVWLTAEAYNELVAAGFLDTSVVSLTAKGENALTPETFIKDTLVPLTAEAANTLEAKGYLDGTLVYLSAEAANTLVAAGYLDKSTVSISAEKGNTLVGKDYLDATQVSLTAEMANTLKAAGYLDENNVYITAEAANELVAAGYLDTTTIGLTAQADNELTGDSFMTGTKVKLTAEMANHLAAMGFLDGSKVQLTPEIASYLEANGFLSGSTVSLTAEAAYKLAATGFLNGTQVMLTAEAANKLIAAGFLDATTVSLTGEAGNTLAGTDFVSSTTVDLTANFTNLAELQTAVSELTTKAASAKEAFATAKTDLETMKTRYEELEARLKYAGKKGEKSAIQAEMEALSGVITEQEGKVGELETAYTQVSAELLITSSAAKDLAAKEAELASVKERLAEASGSVVSASSGETGELERQVEVIEALARAKQAELRQQVKDNATKQARQYADAVYESAEQQKYLNAALDTYNRYSQYLALGPEGMEKALKGAYQAMVDLSMADDFSFSENQDAMYSYMHQFEDLLYLMTGEKHDFSGNWAITGNYKDAVASWSEMTDAEAAAAGNVEKYQATVNAANAVQKLFVDNMVNGIRDGGMSLQQVEGLLNETFSNTYGGAELVAQVMEQVRAELEGAADASGGMSEGLDSTAASATDVNGAIAPIIAQMEALGTAYQEAYDKAYDSMDGQFKLFEEAPTLTKASVDEMISALQSQQAYMEQYAANLQAAAEMGVSDGLLAKLSDGSTESAAYLAAIVSDGATKIDELNTAFAGVEDGKTDFANTVAEMQTDFATKMTELQTQLTTTVSEMDMTEEAAAAGSSTVQAFADAASNLTPTVQAAFKKVADAAKAALKVSISAGPSGVSAYASGTESAEPGFALVGEEGPELVYFRGGEQVATAQETAAIADQRSFSAEPISAVTAAKTQSGNTVSVVVKPEYNIAGNVDTDDLRAVLTEQNANLRAMVEDIMDDIESDKERSVYA